METPTGKPAPEVIMLCLDCPDRDHCEAPCASLEKDLSGFDYYQREIIVSPAKLEYMAEAYINIFETRMEPGLDTDIMDVHMLMKLLSDEQKNAIRLYFWKSLSVFEISEKMKINRSSVYKMLKRGLKVLSKMVDSYVE